MKKLFLTLSVLAISAASASAADMAVKAPVYSNAPVMTPAYDWSGFYIGLNGGGGSAHECWNIINDGDGPVAPPIPEGCHNATGGTVGGQIGYRWQMATWVFGIEGQGNWADFKGSAHSLYYSVLNDSTNVQAFGLLTGQVGYAINNVLFYVKGGAAVTGNRSYLVSAGGNLPVGSVFANGSATRWGGAAGLGVEYGFAPNWSVAVEYDHLFMGKQNVTLLNNISNSLVAIDSISQDIDIGTIRLNYKFGGPVVAKY